MSLVSALPERTKTASSRTSTITSASAQTTATTTTTTTTQASMGKIYHTEGEPLSKEALYRAKMKYGQYQSPANNYTIGVSNAKLSADAAASLADSSHVNVPTYIREIDVNAHKAARSIGKRNSKKMSSRTSSITSNSQVSGIGSASAASKAYSMSYVQSPLETSSSASLTESTNRTYSISSAASAATRKSLTSATSVPKKASTTSLRPNYSKLINAAERKADATMKDRSDPERKNFQYGIRKSVSNSAEDRKQFEINQGTMQKVMNKNANSKERISAQKLEQENDMKRSKRLVDAKNAAVKVKDKDYYNRDIDQEIAQKKRERDEYLRQLTSTQVLSIARAKVDQQMNLIETAQAENRIFENDSYNKAAIAMAQSRSENREKTRNQYANKINLGGGLWLSPEDINQISQNLLNPILGEIDSTAKEQRETDLEIQQRTKKYNEELASWKAMQQQKDANDIKIVKDMQLKRDTEFETISNQLSEEYNKLKLDLQSQVDAKQKDLDDTIQRYEDLKEEFEMRLNMENELADKEIDSWQKYQDNMINDAEREQTELLAPYNEQLDIANKTHDQLSTEYDNILTDITKLQAVIDGHKAKVEEYTELIKVQEAREDREVSLLNNLTEDKEALNTTLEEDIMVRAQRVKEQLQLSSKEYEMKQLEIGAMINERQDNLQKIDINLQEERLKLLDAMQKVSKVRGDEKLDENKIKTLFGMTSDEFMEKHGVELPEDEAAKEVEAKEVEAKETTPKVEVTPVQDDEAENENDEEEGDEEDDDDTPSFSGFSQGSINNNEESKHADLASPGHSEDTGYFKEVF